MRSRKRSADLRVVPSTRPDEEGGNATAAEAPADAAAETSPG